MAMSKFIDIKLTDKIKFQKQWIEKKIEKEYLEKEYHLRDNTTSENSNWESIT